MHRWLCFREPSERFEASRHGLELIIIVHLRHAAQRVISDNYGREVLAVEVATTWGEERGRTAMYADHHLYQGVWRYHSRVEKTQ